MHSTILAAQDRNSLNRPTDRTEATSNQPVTVTLVKIKDLIFSMIDQNSFTINLRTIIH